MPLFHPQCNLVLYKFPHAVAAIRFIGVPYTLFFCRIRQELCRIIYIRKVAQLIREKPGENPYNGPLPIRKAKSTACPRPKQHKQARTQRKLPEDPHNTQHHHHHQLSCPQPADTDFTTISEEPMKPSAKPPPMGTAIKKRQLRFRQSHRRCHTSRLRSRVSPEPREEWRRQRCRDASNKVNGVNRRCHRCLRTRRNEVFTRAALPPTT